MTVRGRTSRSHPREKETGVSAAPRARVTVGAGLPHSLVVEPCLHQLNACLLARSPPPGRSLAAPRGRCPPAGAGRLRRRLPSIGATPARRRSADAAGGAPPAPRAERRSRSRGPSPMHGAGGAPLRPAPTGTPPPTAPGRTPARRRAPVQLPPGRSRPSSPLPANFERLKLATRVGRVMAIDVAPNDDVFIAERDGALKIWKANGDRGDRRHARRLHRQRGRLAGRHPRSRPSPPTAGST